MKYLITMTKKKCTSVLWYSRIKYYLFSLFLLLFLVLKGLVLRTNELDWTKTGLSNL